MSDPIPTPPAPPATPPAPPAPTPPPPGNPDPAPSNDPPLGPAGEKALEAWKERAKAAELAQKEYEAKLKLFEDRDKSELEKLKEQVAQSQAAAQAAELESLRQKVIATTGLPPELHEFLTGDTEEALQAKAKKLAEHITTKPRPPVPDPSQGPKPPATPVTQLTRADLARMSPQEIEQAQKDGRLAEVLGVKP